MRHPFPARRILVTAASLALSLPVSLLAQQPTGPPQFPASLADPLDPSPENQSRLTDSAALLLPEAPQIQNATAAATPAPTAAPTAPQPPPCAVSQNASSSSSVSAQTTPAASTAPCTAPPNADPTTAEDPHAAAERQLKIEEKQRLLGVMPQFQVVMGGSAAPLSAGQKWRLALHSAIDPFYIGWAFVVGGGYGELVDSDTGYDWGAAGYFKRVAANYADNVNGAIIGNALLPSILHQDPRYFRKGAGSIKSRLVYAALSTVICRGDNGKNQPNVSNVLGNFISGAISNAYYPADQRGVRLTLENGLSVTLFGALGGQLLEFGPDLARLVHHKKHGPVPAATPATSPSPDIPATPVAPAP